MTDLQAQRSTFNSVDQTSFRSRQMMSSRKKSTSMTGAHEKDPSSKPHGTTNGTARNFISSYEHNSDDRGKQSNRKLGTLNGVFLPCLQTILGVILFIRLTSITAQAGCVHTTVIILLCTASTLVTAISLSAIATNGTICAGGPYYVISRTLGIEIGGAIGLLFYLGTTIASSMYALGAVEAILNTLGIKHAPGGIDGILFPFDTQLMSLLLMFLIACVVNVGVKYVNMTSNFFLALVFLSIFCMCLGCCMFATGHFLGELTLWDRLYFDNIWPKYEPDPVTGAVPDFFSLLAIFYPSVTGILAGSNRSAVLADPATAIPKGTIGAIFSTTALYIFVVWLFGMSISNYSLKSDKFITAAIAFPQSNVVKIGVIVSCVGAALQCMAGAPNLLVAIAMDDSMPILSYIKPRDKNDDLSILPKRAVWVTWFIASIPTLAGNLDHISPIVTMFYLLMYAGINFSCFMLGVFKAPGFRPTFRYYHWSISLFGFLWCLGLAVIIDPFLAFVAIIMLFSLYFHNKKQKARKDWGDVFDTVKYSIVTQTLRSLTNTTTEHLNAKNWRPQLLTVVDIDNYGNPENLHVLSLASQLKKGQGINVVVSIIDHSSKKNCRGGLDEHASHELVEHSKNLLQQHMRREQMEGFAEVFVTTSSMSEAIWSAVIHSGLGPLSPNTVLLSLPTTVERKQIEGFEETFLKTIKGIRNLKVALMLFRGCDTYPTSVEIISAGSIHIWWVVHDGGLLLLLPFILSKNAVWGKSRAQLKIFAITTSPTENPGRLREAIEDHLSQVRISATVVVLDMSGTTIAESMLDSDFVDKAIVGSQNAANGTNHCDRTVGEHFMSSSYEVPYIPFNEDIESGEAFSDGLQTYTFDNHEMGGPETYDRTERIDDDSINSDNESFYTIENGETKEENKDIDESVKAAAALNSLFKLHSFNANLIVTNMPRIEGVGPAKSFFDYVDTMCDKLDNVLLVRGSGAEVITTYA